MFCIGMFVKENTVYREFNAACGFRHPWVDEGGLLSMYSILFHLALRSSLFCLFYLFFSNKIY
jgi:hypothetical protein